MNNYKKVLLLFVCFSSEVAIALNLKNENSTIELKSGSQLILNSSVTASNGVIKVLGSTLSTAITATNTNNTLTFSSGFFKTPVVYNSMSGVFDPSTSGFGDGTRIELGPDVTIGSSDASWAFFGNAEIDGNGATLTINKSQGVTITGTSKTLTLKNMRLVTSTTDAIKCLTSSCKIKLQNVDWVIASNFVFSVGSCDIADTVKILSDSGTISGIQIWEFSSSGIMTVLNSAELIFGQGTKFKYNADPSGAANFAATKRKFLLNQVGSKLTFISSTLESTATGLALDQGILTFSGNSVLKSSTSTGAQLEIGEKVDVLVHGRLDIKGPIYYNENPALLYGDGVSLLHTNYGGYLGSYSSPGNDPSGWNAYKISSLGTVSRWYIWPGLQDDRYNAGNIQTNVKSGDVIKMETFQPYTSGFTTWTRYMLCNYTTGALVSSPTPPYYAAWLYPAGNGYDVNHLFRIYKKGADVGDFIYKNDIIYFVYYQVSIPAYSYTGTNAYYYVGSSDLQYSVYGKEIFWFRTSLATAPSNFTTQCTWQIVEHLPAAYLTGTFPSGYGTVGPGAAFYPVWQGVYPSAALTQF